MQKVLARKKIFIPGGKFDDLFLIEAAHRFGFDVITSGTERNAPGHRAAEKYVYADSSDLEAMLKIAQDEHIDVMCSCAHDFGYIATTYVCEKLGLPGHDSYETALTIHKKDRFKALAKKIGLSIPGGESFSSRDDALEYLKGNFSGSGQKMIMKPVDSCAGRGITEVTSFEECGAAVDRAFEGSRLKRIVVEPYVEGTLHSASVFLVDRKAVFCFIEEGFVNPENPYGVMCAISPARDKKDIEPQLAAEIEKVAQALDLVDGKIHTNFIVDDSGKIWILEMHRRCSGDTYAKFIEFSTGIKWNEWIVKSECGMSVKDFPRGVEQAGFHMTLVFMAKHNGIYHGVNIHEELKTKINACYFHLTEGESIEDYRLKRIGVAHLEFTSYDEMKLVAENPDKYFEAIVKE